jgi:hypothetical protein
VTAVSDDGMATHRRWGITDGYDAEPCDCAATSDHDAGEEVRP